MGASSKYRAGWLELWLGLGSVAVLVLASGGCGGSAPSPSSPTSESPHGKKAKAAAPEEAAEDDAPAEEESEPPRSACDDGSCSPCGSGMCPTGWYCDESLSAGPACSWLPQCAQKSSCGCITSALGSACKCSEQSGGLHVTCK